jgi:hypothetical protein
MLFRIVELLKRNDNLKGLHHGFVVDNKDPKKLGRVKVYIKGLIQDADKAKLPWCYPIMPPDSGGRANTSQFCVPEEKSEVVVTFPYDDIYHPFYVGWWPNEKNMQTGLFDASYPEVYGRVDSNHQWTKVDKKEKFTEFFSNIHGALIRIDKDGNFHINVPKSLIINVKKDLSFKVGGKETHKVAGNVSIDCGATLGLKVANDLCGKAGANIDWQAGGGIGEVAGGMITSEGATVVHNTGAKIGAVGGAMSGVAGDVSALESEISNINSKIDELKSLVSGLQSKADSLKAALVPE